jgi:hypothetical protein
MENANIEGIRQDLCTRLVQREIVCCASSLMSGIAAIMHDVPYKTFHDAFCTDTDEVQELFSSPGYTEAARQFIMDDADVEQLEEVADEHGYWSDIIDECLPEVSEGPPDEDGDTQWTFKGNTSGVGFADEDDAREAAIDHVLPKIRAQVWDLVDSTADAAQEVCSEYNLDYDYNEVYEHWVVSDWLQRKLASHGEITGDFGGLTIWGRCCTGQSISMDHVIREISAELWPEEWAGVKA